MGKVKLFIASSLDGFITRKDGSVDWLFTDQDYGYLEFYEPIEFILMGRKTYEKVLEFGEYPYPGKKCFVFTHSPLLQQHSKDIEFFSGDIGLFVRKLCEHSTADIWLVGGSEIIKVFLQEKILHEIIVSIHPVILGDGIPLFDHVGTETNLKLLRTTDFESGLVQLFYEVSHDLQGSDKYCE